MVVTIYLHLSIEKKVERKNQSICSLKFEEIYIRYDKIRVELYILLMFGQSTYTYSDSHLDLLYLDKLFVIG